MNKMDLLLIFQSLFLAVAMVVMFHAGRKKGVKVGVDIGIVIGRAAEREGLGEVTISDIKWERGGKKDA